MKYKKPNWAVQQIIRMSGLVEDVCKHGVGHPNQEWLQQNDFNKDLSFAIHGCDGCCSKKEVNNNEQKERRTVKVKKKS